MPNAVLWIQSVVAFDVYYYYFNGYGDVIRKAKDEGSNSLLSNIWLPGLPLMNILDLPSFVVSDDHMIRLVLKTFEEKMQVLEEENDVPILVNSFDALEHDALTAIGKFNLIPIGPLVSVSPKSEASTKQQTSSYFQDGTVFVLFGLFLCYFSFILEFSRVFYLSV